MGKKTPTFPSTGEFTAGFLNEPSTSTKESRTKRITQKNYGPFETAPVGNSFATFPKYELLQTTTLPETNIAREN